MVILIVFRLSQMVINWSNPYFIFFRLFKMDFKNELLDDNLFPIDVDFIKKEEIEEEESFSVAGIVESIKSDKISVKEELYENEEVENYSSTNVLFYVSVSFLICILVLDFSVWA